MKRKAAWACLALLLGALAYEFAPDGSSLEGVPAELGPQARKAVARLRSRRPSRRCDAAHELGRLGAGAAAPFLVALLNDRAEAMGPVERIFQGLMFGARSREVGACAEFGLSQLGSAATPLLTEAFESRDELVRRRATSLLALSKDPRAAEFLSPHLKDPDPHVRLCALTAVAQSRRPGWIEAIGSALQDRDAEVRRAALTNAGAWEGPWVYEAFLSAANDPDAGVRFRAVDRLGRIGDGRAIDVLIGRLSDDDLGVRQMAHSSLKMLTKVDQGPDPAAWKAWRQNSR